MQRFRKPRNPRRSRSPEERLLDLLHRLFVVAKADSWRAAWPQGLTPTQIAVLRVVKGSRRAKDITGIAHELGCSHTTASRAIRALDDKCFIKTERDPWDRRRVLVRPLAAGSPRDLWEPGYGEVLPGRIEVLDDRELAVVESAIQILLRHVPPNRRKPPVDRVEALR